MCQFISKSIMTEDTICLEHTSGVPCVWITYHILTSKFILSCTPGVCLMDICVSGLGRVNGRPASQSSIRVMCKVSLPLVDSVTCYVCEDSLDHSSPLWEYEIFLWWDGQQLNCSQFRLHYMWGRCFCRDDTATHFLYRFLWVTYILLDIFSIFFITRQIGHLILVRIRRVRMRNFYTNLASFSFTIYLFFILEQTILQGSYCHLTS